MASINSSITLSKRYNLFPIQDHDAYKAYIGLESTFWSAFELSYTKDKPDYEKLKSYDPTGKNAKMKRLIDYFLGFVLPADGLICENLMDYFLKNAETFEERLFFTCQIHNEAIHGLVYGLIAQTLTPEPEEQKKLFELVDNLPCLKAKIDLMEKYKSNNFTKAERYVAFACAEGIFFCVLFNIIFWFKSKNMFKNLIAANRMIGADESAHRNFGCNRYKKRNDKNSQSTLEIVKEFVEIEKMFIEVMIPEPIEDLTHESLTQYLYTVADNLLVELGESRYYNSNYSPEWMSDINLNQKINFFEDINTAYNRFSAKDALDIDQLTGRTKKIDAIENAEDVDF